MVWIVIGIASLALLGALILMVVVMLVVLLLVLIATTQIPIWDLSILMGTDTQVAPVIVMI